jgi:lipid-A-disaccharide synthase
MKYFIIAGEASGDMHGAGLIRAIRRRDSDAVIECFGGDAMQSAGGRLIRHYREMAFMGFFNVLLNARKVIANFRIARKALRSFMPDVVILIDYPGFNLKLSTFVVEQLALPVYYYIAPKVWAWKTYRVKQLKREMNGILTIFPFETDFFARYGIDVHYVGNPTVDAVNAYVESESLSEMETRKLLGLNSGGYLALLPGSRRQEIVSCLPEMIKAANRLNLPFVIAGAPGIEPAFYEKCGAESSRVVTGHTYRMVRYATVAIVNSGTATLETALLTTPQVVVYRVMGGRLTYWLKNKILKIPHISLVNILLRKEVVAELVAHLMTAENIESEVKRILLDKGVKDKMLASYAELADQLGAPGTADRAAEFVIYELKK